MYSQEEKNDSFDEQNPLEMIPPTECINPCDKCGVHDCGQRNIAAQSQEAADMLGPRRMIFWTVMLFLVPLVSGWGGSILLPILLSEPLNPHLPVFGACLGFALGVFIAWISVKCFPAQ